MKILHISYSDLDGGASRAAYRIHQSLISSGIHSEMLVLNKNSNDSTVIEFSPNAVERLMRKYHNKLDRFHRRGWSTKNTTLHSLGHIGYERLVKIINASEADIVNLHWLCGLLSIKQIGKIEKPIVWTLHDMWAFSGGEHYNFNEDDKRFAKGYSKDSRGAHDVGRDVNAISWNLKDRIWKNKKFTIIGDSQWLTNCAKESNLFKNKPCFAVGYPLDMDVLWRPTEKTIARKILGVSNESRVIVMGAVGGMSDLRKGGELLIEALRSPILNKLKNIEVIIYGQNEPEWSYGIPFKVHWMGSVSDDRRLAIINSAADVAVIPSRQEAFGQTVLEAQACGIPVVAFNVGGIPDILDHGVNGYLAKPFDIDDLASGISLILSGGIDREAMSRLARDNAVKKFSPHIIAKKYKEIYADILINH